MANVKISQLPEYSGTPTGGYSVLNNSGETTTYKVKNYNLFGNTNIINNGDYPFVTGSGNTISGIGAVGVIGKGNNIDAGYLRGDFGGSLTIGYNNTITDPYAGNFLTVGANNTGNAHHAIVFGQYNTVNYGFAGMVGGYFNTSTNETGIVVSMNSNISGFNNAVLGGRFNQMIGYAGGIGGTENNGMLGGYYNNLTGGIQSTILGGQYNNISGQQYGDLDRCYYSSILGGDNNKIDQFITGSTIVGSGYSSISGASGTTKYSTINGGSGNTIASSSYSSIIGGQNGYIDNSNNSQILGGFNNTINCEQPGVEKYNTIINGSGNTIFDVSDDQSLQTIIGSTDTTFQNGSQRVVGLGLSGRTINDGANTTYVEHLKAFRQVAEGFYDNGSVPAAGYTIDLNNGAKQQITITGAAGNTNLYFTGNIAGGRLVLKVVNTSTGDLGFADNTPYIWRIPSVYPSASPNATDIYIFESFGDQELWLASQSKNLS